MFRRAKWILGGAVLLVGAITVAVLCAVLLTRDSESSQESAGEEVPGRDEMTSDEVTLSKDFGPIEFDVSDRVPKSARDRFLLGLKALAMFWYDLAEEQFLRAQAIEPSFGMAYWGEAMCHMQFLWAVKRGDVACRILGKIEAQNATVAAKNAFYITSAKTLFDCDGRNKTEIEMVHEFSTMLKGVLDVRPNGVFLACLYSLSLMEKNYGGAHSPQVEEARRVLKGVLRDHPKYPYALHVFMHAYDWPGVAQEALDEALVSLEVLKASAHGLHMPCHIFVRLGLWQDAILGDRKALKAGDDFARKFRNGSYSYDGANRYHSLEWLQFELLQQGSYGEAEQYLDRMRSVFLKDSSVPYRQWYYTMIARQWLETRHLNTEVLGEPVPFTVTAFWSLIYEMYYQVAYGLSVLKSSLPDKLSRAEGTIRRLEEMANQTKPSWQSFPNVTEFIKLQLQSQLELARDTGDSSQRFLRALGIMERAVKIQDGTLSTSSDPALPWALLPWEFYGDMILASNFTDNFSYMEKAALLFKRSLDHYPNRSAALLGLVRVNLKRGNCTEAIRWYDKLKKHWKPLLSDHERKVVLNEEYRTAPNNCSEF